MNKLEDNGIKINKYYNNKVAILQIETFTII
jgi:hypothetical protein